MTTASLVLIAGNVVMKSASLDASKKQIENWTNLISGLLLFRRRGSWRERVGRRWLHNEDEHSHIPQIQ